MCWRKSSSHVGQQGGVDSVNRSRSSRLAKSKIMKSQSRNKRERGRESNEGKRMMKVKRNRKGKKSGRKSSRGRKGMRDLSPVLPVSRYRRVSCKVTRWVLGVYYIEGKDGGTVDGQ